MGGENGDLIRELLSSATLYFNELDKGAQITVEGRVAGIIPVSYEIQPGSTEDELHSMSPGQPVVLSGGPEELFGDRATDFQEEDTLVISDTVITSEMFDWYLSSAVLTFDLDLDGEVDGEIILEGDYFEGAEFNLEIIGNDTNITVDLNQAPVASNDDGSEFETDESSPFTTGSVLSNDSDDDGDLLSVSGVDITETRGLVVDNGDGTFDYDPNRAFDDLLVGETASDTFAYFVTDGIETVRGEVTITITGEDDTLRDKPEVQPDVDATLTFTGSPGPDDIFNLLGGQLFALGGGADVVRGPVENFFDDVIDGFGLDDLILFEGSSIARSAIDVTFGSAILDIDTDGDGSSNGEFTLEGDFSAGDFMAVGDSGDTRVTFETFLPELQERQAVDPDFVNGIINQNFLKGDGTTDFQVTLSDLSLAGYDNVLGVYEIDAVGNLIDTRILFENANADNAVSVLIEDVEDGHNLGFFIVQDAADWAATFTAGDALSFVDSSGGAANISDGADISIAVNGAAVDEMVFHSFDETMNSDGIQHALSGVGAGGEAITIGFEDLTGGGDLDYQDVVFRIGVIDDLTFI